MFSNGGSSLESSNLVTSDDHTRSPLEMDHPLRVDDEIADNSIITVRRLESDHPVQALVQHVVLLLQSSADLVTLGARVFD